MDKSKSIYEVSGVLSKQCEKSHITYAFYLEESTDAIHIDFEYSPGIAEEDESRRLILEAIERDTACDFSVVSKAWLTDNWKRFHPVKNLLTLSVDDENGFRGASHRHRKNPPESITIGSDYVSPGYFKGRIPRGNLSVTISTHALTASCEYTLRVYKDGGANE